MELEILINSYGVKKILKSKGKIILKVGQRVFLIS